MNIIRNILALIGLYFVVLYVAGSLNIGDFQYYFNPVGEVTCTKTVKEVK